MPARATQSNCVKTFAGAAQAAAHRVMRAGRLHRTMLPVAAILVHTSFWGVALPAACQGGPFGQAARLFKSFEVETNTFRLCNQADSLMNSGAFAQARDVLSKAAQNDRTSYSSYVHLQLARCYKALKNYNQAIAEAETSLRFNPNYSDALYCIAQIYFDLDKYSQALSYLKQYARTSSQSGADASTQKFIRETDAYNSLTAGIKCMQSGHNQDARRFLDRAAALDPTPYSASIHANLSFVLRQTGNPQAAIEEGKRALQLEPNQKETIYNIGIAYEDLTRFDEAIQWVKRYIAMESDSQQRADAASRIKGIEDDKAQFNDPVNKLPDYLDLEGGQKWPRKKLPLQIFIESGKGVPGYLPSFPACIPRSLDAWCEASGRKLNYTLTKDKANADIRVEWTNQPLDATSSHPNAQPVGLTQFESDTYGQIADATIQIRTVDPFNPKDGMELGEVASTCVHEVGHALGLGHSKVINDVMYFRNNSQQNGLPSKRDRATIARLYAGYPQVQFTPSKETANPSTPITFLPPPTFMPPKPPSNEKLEPPLFIPPPVDPKGVKLQPPTFTPPPIKATPTGDPKPSVPGSPVYVPSPDDKNGSKPVAGTKPADRPIFVPPPAK